MAAPRSRLRVVFGRIVVASLPLSGTVACGPTAPSCEPAVEVVVFDGGLPEALADGGLYSGAPCQPYCGPFLACETSQTFAGEAALVCRCPAEFFGGRAPAGLLSATLASESVLGRHLAACAHLEAASVVAFRGLAHELARWNAPAHLVRAATRSAREEVGHARAMTRLARRAGAKPPPVRLAPQPPRSLEAFATENAVEGCVRETYGALLATWQSETAGDPDARAVMKTIAVDETRHAEFSWSVAGWADSRVSPDARRRIQEARRSALAHLAADAEREPDPVLVGRLGIPSARTARELLAALTVVVTDLERRV